MNKEILKEVTFKKSKLNTKSLNKTFRDYGVVLIKDILEKKSLDKLVIEAK